jgi:hypothetical protein
MVMQLVILESIPVSRLFFPFLSPFRSRTSASLADLGTSWPQMMPCFQGEVDIISALSGQCLLTNTKHHIPSQSTLWVYSFYLTLSNPSKYDIWSQHHCENMNKKFTEVTSKWMHETQLWRSPGDILLLPCVPSVNSPFSWCPDPLCSFGRKSFILSFQFVCSWVLVGVTYITNPLPWPHDDSLVTFHSFPTTHNKNLKQLLTSTLWSSVFPFSGLHLLHSKSLFFCALPLMSFWSRKYWRYSIMFFPKHLNGFPHVLDQWSPCVFYSYCEEVKFLLRKEIWMFSFQPSSVDFI